jgi:peptidoglycan/LPS O-acetylase OafA/YrhL
MALSIMIYHLGSQHYVEPWHFAVVPLDRLGIYGVSIFFVLSGLSMAIAYDRHIKDLRTSGTFFIRRLFRIWPLLWLVVSIVALQAYFYGHPYSLYKIGLNLTTLFGFIAPTQYINTGAWSIGNEMVYYAMTPLLIGAFHFRKWLGNLLTIAAFAIGIYFAFFLLHPGTTLGSQWPVYVNPFNNLFLYCAGLAIYYNFRDKNLTGRWRPVLLIATIAAFFLYPFAGDQINIVTGVSRIAMSLISVAIVFEFYKFPPSLPDFVDQKLEQLGIATYGVYLLHPIVASGVLRVFRKVGVHNSYLIFFTVVGLTITIALLTFRFMEQPLLKFGKCITESRTRSTA